MTTESRRYISCADTAKLVRVVLKARWPNVKFSVRSSVYSGGASIDIKWTDGPSSKQVETLAKKFEGASFDGMIDLKSYNDSEWQGQRVHFGADYVFCHREITNLDETTKTVDLMLRRYYAPSILKGIRTEWDTIGSRLISDMARSIIYAREENETLEDCMKRWW